MNVRLGCKRDARKAVRGELRRLGEGISRTGYADPKGRVVYKVERDGRQGTNRYEHDAAKRWRDLGIPCMPPATLWVVEDCGKRYDVIAMPMVSLLGDAVDKRVTELAGPTPEFPDIDWAFGDPEYERACREYDMAYREWAEKARDARRAIADELRRVREAVDEARAVAREHGVHLADLHEWNYGVAEDGSVIITDLGEC